MVGLLWKGGGHEGSPNHEMFQNEEVSDHTCQAAMGWSRRVAGGVAHAWRNIPSTTPPRPSSGAGLEAGALLAAPLLVLSTCTHHVTPDRKHTS